MARTVKYIFDPFKMADREGALKGRAKRAAMKDVAGFVLLEILTFVSDGLSPVKGQPTWKLLNKKYAKENKGNDRTPNLDLTGAMLKSMQAKARPRTIEIAIKGRQGDKADGHNNHSGASNLPTRRFIPKNRDSEIFKRDIVNGMKEIIDKHGK